MRAYRPRAASPPAASSLALLAMLWLGNRLPEAFRTLRTAAANVAEPADRPVLLAEVAAQEHGTTFLTTGVLADAVEPSAVLSSKGFELSRKARRLLLDRLRGRDDLNHAAVSERDQAGLLEDREQRFSDAA